MPVRNTFLRIVGDAPDVFDEKAARIHAASATSGASAAGAAGARRSAAQKDGGGRGDQPDVYLASFEPGVGAVSLPLNRADALLRPETQEERAAATRPVKATAAMPPKGGDSASASKRPKPLTGVVKQQQQQSTTASSPSAAAAAAAAAGPGSMATALHPSKPDAVIGGEGTELRKVAQQLAQKPIQHGPTFVLGTPSAEIVKEADTTFRSKGKQQVYLTDSVAAVSVAHPTTDVEADPAAPPPPPTSNTAPAGGPPPARAPADGSAATERPPPTAVSFPAALASCGGDRGRAALYFAKHQASLASAAKGGGGSGSSAADNFPLFEDLVTSHFPRTVPSGMVARDLQLWLNIAKLVAGDAAQRRNVTLVNRGVRHTGKSRAFRDMVRVVVDQLAPVIERALQVFHDERARREEEEAAEVAAIAARGGAMAPPGAGGGGGGDKLGGFEAFGDGPVAPTAPDGEAAERSPRARKAPGSARVGSAATSRFTLSAARSVGGNSPRSRFTLLSVTDGAVTPKPPTGAISTTTPFTPRRGTHGHGHRGGPGGGGAGVRWGASTEGGASVNMAASARSATGGGTNKMFNRRSSVKLRQALAALVAEPNLRKSLKQNGYGEQWHAATFNGTTSVLLLDGVPRVERMMPSFAVDMWFRVVDFAAEQKILSSTGSPLAGTSSTAASPSKAAAAAVNALQGVNNDLKRTPMTLVRWCEGDKHEVGMQFHVGLNFPGAGSGKVDESSRGDDTLRVYLRDSTNRVLEMHLVLIGRTVTDGAWHHLHVRVDSPEETIMHVKIDGIDNDRLRFTQAEHPNAWPSFGPHHMQVGGFKDAATGKVVNPLQGQIAELRVWSPDTGALDTASDAYQAAATEYHRLQAQLGLLPPPTGDADDQLGPMITTATGASVPTTTRLGKIRSKGSSNALTPLLAGERPHSAAGAGGLRTQVSLSPVVRYPLIEIHASDDAGEGGDESTAQSFLAQVVTDSQATAGDAAARSPSPKRAGGERAAGSRGGGGGSNSDLQAAAAAAATTDGADVEVFDVTPQASPAPTASPLFDGHTTCINAGTLGEFGGYLQNFAVEIRFRTSTTERMMSLVGVTDTQFKKPQLLVALNAEPTMTADRVRYHRYHTAFCLVDATGRAMSAILRGSEQNSLCDGHWHTLQWRVHDAESNKMEVKVDGQTQDAVVSVREGPKNFVPLHEWVAIGGHNVRGWKTRELFEGMIKSATFSVRGDKYVEYTLVEGPGATMAVDCSGHGFHAAFYDAEAKQRAKHGLTWCTQFDDQADDELLDEDAAVGPGGKRSGPLIHLRNDVRFALLNFTTHVDPVTGRATEAVYDMLAPAPAPREVSAEESSPRTKAKAQRRASLIRQQRQKDKDSRAVKERRRSMRALSSHATSEAAGRSPNADGDLLDGETAKRAESEDGDNDSIASDGHDAEDSPNAPMPPGQFQAALSQEEEDDAIVANAVKPLPPPPFGASMVELEYGPSKLSRVRRGLVSDADEVWGSLPDACFHDAESSNHPKVALSTALHFVAETEAFVEAQRRIGVARHRIRDARESARKKAAQAGGTFSAAAAAAPADAAAAGGAIEGILGMLPDPDERLLAVDGDDDDLVIASSPGSDSPQDATARRRARLIARARHDQQDSRYRHMPRIGHLVAVVCIGDCQLTFMDMRGPTLAPNAQYAPHMVRWTAPVASYGGDQKAIATLNASFVALDATLQHTTACPSLVRHCGLATPPQQLHSHLEKQSYPTALADVAYSGLMNFDFGSRLVNVFSLPVFHTEDDALSFAVPMRVIESKSSTAAATTLQRVVRGLLGRQRFRRMREMRETRRHRVQELASLRESQKANFLPKPALVATVLACLDPNATESCASVRDYDAAVTAVRNATAARQLVEAGVTPAGGASKDGDAAGDDGNTDDQQTGGRPAAASVARDPARVDLLPPISSVLLNKIVSALNSQGYTVRLHINPDAAALSTALRSLDPNASHLVYVVGYGAARVATPRPLRLLALEIEGEEDLGRMAIEREARANDFYEATREAEEAERAEAAAATEARLRASSKKGKRGGSASPARRAPAPPAAGKTTAKSPTAPPAASSAGGGRRGGRGDKSGRGGNNAATKEQEAAEAAQQAMHVQQKAVMFEEEQVRAASVVRLQDQAWSLLTSEMRKAVHALRQHEDSLTQRANALAKFKATWLRASDENRLLGPNDSKQRIRDLAATLPPLVVRRSGKDTHTALLTDVPPVEATISTEEIVTAALRHNATPVGYQCAVVVDLLPVSGFGHVHVGRAQSAEEVQTWDGFAVRSIADAMSRPHGATLLATSAGPALGYHYRPGAQQWSSWQFAKALHGHVAINIVSDQDADGILCGAVPSLPSDDCRDAVSVLDFIGGKLEGSPATDPQTLALVPSVSKLLEVQQPYNGDVVPLRVEATTSASRADIRKTTEAKRFGGTVRMVVDSNRTAMDVVHDLRAHLPELQATEANPTNRVFVTFTRCDNTSPHLHSLANLDVANVREQLSRSLPPGGVVAMSLAVAGDGLVITVHGTGVASATAERTKITQTVVSLAQRAGICTYPCVQKPAFDSTRTAESLRGLVAAEYVAAGLPPPVDEARGTSHFAMRDVCIEYTSHGTTTVAKWHRVVRRCLERPILTDGLRLSAAEED